MPEIIAVLLVVMVLLLLASIALFIKKDFVMKKLITFKQGLIWNGLATTLLVTHFKQLMNCSG